MHVMKTTPRGRRMIGLSCLSIVHGQALLGIADNDTIHALANITNVTKINNIPNNVTLAAQASAMFASGASASSMPKNGMRANRAAPVTHDSHSFRIKKVETLVPPEVAARKAGITLALGKDSVIEIGWFRVNLESDGSPSSNETVAALAALEAYQAREAILLDQLERKNEADTERAAFLDTLERKLKQDAADAEAKKQQDDDKLARDKETLHDQRIAFSYKVMHALRNDPTGLTIYRGPITPPGARGSHLEYLNAIHNTSQHDSTSRQADLLQYLDQRVIIAVVSLASKVMVILLARAGRRARKTAMCDKLAKQIERAMIFLGEPIVVYQEKIIDRPVEIIKVVFVDRSGEAEQASKEPAAGDVEEVAAREEETARRVVEAPEQVRQATQADLSVVSSKQHVKVEAAAASSPAALNNEGLDNGISGSNHITDRDLSVVLYKDRPLVLYKRKFKVGAADAPAPEVLNNGVSENKQATDEAMEVVSDENQANDEGLPAVSENNQATDEDLPVVSSEEEDKVEAAVAPMPEVSNNGVSENKQATDEEVQVVSDENQATDEGLPVVSENNQAIDEDMPVVTSEVEDKIGTAVASTPEALNNGASENKQATDEAMEAVSDENQATDEDEPLVQSKQEDKVEAAVALALETLNNGLVEPAMLPALELAPAVSNNGPSVCNIATDEELSVVSVKHQDKVEAASAPAPAPIPAVCTDGISEYTHATDRDLPVVSSKRPEVEVAAVTAPKPDPLEVRRMLLEKARRGYHRVLKGVWRILDERMASDSTTLRLSQRLAKQPAVQAMPQVDWNQILKMAIGHPAVAVNREVIVSDFVRLVFGLYVAKAWPLIETLNRPQVHQELGYCPLLLHDARRRLSRRRPHRKGHGYNAARSRLLQRFENLTARRPAFETTRPEQKSHKAWRALAIRLNGDLKKENDRVKALEVNSQNWEVLAFIDIPPAQPVCNENEMAKQPEGPADEARKQKLEAKSAVTDESAKALVSTANSSAKASAMSMLSPASLPPPAVSSGATLDSSLHRSQVSTQPNAKKNRKTLIVPPVTSFIAIQQSSQMQTQSSPLPAQPAATKVALDSSRHHPAAKTDGNEQHLPNAMDKKEVLPAQEQSVQHESSSSVKVQDEAQSTEARSHIDQCLLEVDSAFKGYTSDVKAPKECAGDQTKRNGEKRGTVSGVRAETPVSTAKASVQSMQSPTSLPLSEKPSGASLSTPRHRPQIPLQSSDLAPRPAAAKVTLGSSCHNPAAKKNRTRQQLPNAIGNIKALPAQEPQPLDQSVQLEFPSSVKVQGEAPSTKARSHIDQCLPELESHVGPRALEVKQLDGYADDQRKQEAEDKDTLANVPAETPACTAKVSARPLAKSMHSPSSPASLDSSRHRPQVSKQSKAKKHPKTLIASPAALFIASQQSSQTQARTQSFDLTPQPAVAAKVALNSSRHNPVPVPIKNGNEQQLPNAAVEIEASRAQMQQPLDQSVQLVSPSSVQLQGETPSSEARSHIDQRSPEVKSSTSANIPQFKRSTELADDQRKTEVEDKDTLTHLPAKTPVSTAKACAKPMQSPTSLPLPANASGASLSSSRHRPQTQTQSSDLTPRPAAARVTLSASRHNPVLEKNGNEQQVSTAVDKNEASRAQKHPFDEPSQTLALPPEQERKPSTKAPLQTEELEFALPELDSASESENDDDEQPEESADGQAKRRPKGQGFAKRRAHLLAEITIALVDRPAKRQSGPVHAHWLSTAESLNQRIKQENARIGRMEKNPAGWEMLDLIDLSGQSRPRLPANGLYLPPGMHLTQLAAGALPPQSFQTQTQSSGLTARPAAASTALGSSRHSPVPNKDGNEQHLPNAAGDNEAPPVQRQPLDESAQLGFPSDHQQQEPPTEARSHIDQNLPVVEDASDSENEDDEQSKDAADGQRKRMPKGKGFAKRRARLVAEITLALLDRPAKRQPGPVHAHWLATAESLNQRIKQENARISRLEKNPAGWEALALIDVSKHLQYLHQAPLGMHRPPVTPLGMHQPHVMALGHVHAGSSPMSFAPRTPYPMPHRQQPGQSFPQLPTYGQLQAVQPRPMRPREGVRGGPRPETAHEALNGDRSKNGGKTGIARGTGIGSSVWSGRGRGGGRA